MRDLVRGGKRGGDALRGARRRGARGQCPQGRWPATEEPVAWPEEPAPWAEETAAWAAVPGAWAGVPTEPPATIASPPLATSDGQPLAVPIGFGFAVIAAALLALVFANPFGAGGWRVRSTRRVRRRAPRGSEARPGRASRARVAEGTPTVDTPTDPTARRRPARSPSRPRSCANAAADRRRDARTRSDGDTYTSTVAAGSDADAQASRNASSDPDPCPDADAEPGADTDAGASACLPHGAGSRRPDRREGPRHVDGPPASREAFTAPGGAGNQIGRDPEPAGRRLPAARNIDRRHRLTSRSSAASATPGILSTRAPVAQWIERWVPDPKVAGSSPVGRASATSSGRASANPCA